jgi:AcrR family transcriptional regulator
MSRENPSAARSKRWIQESLIAMMRETPYDQIKISEICKRADLTRPTFYQHFKSKEEALLQYLDTLFDAFSDSIGSCKIQSIYELAYRFFMFWEIHYEFIDILEENGILSLLNKRFPIYLNEIIRMLAVAPKEMPAQAQDYVNTFISGGLVSMLKLWISHKRNVSAEALADYLEKSLSFHIAYING